MHPCEPFRSGAPTHILVHPSVHRALRLKSAVLQYVQSTTSYADARHSVSDWYIINTVHTKQQCYCVLILSISDFSLGQNPQMRAKQYQVFIDNLEQLST